MGSGGGQRTCIQLEEDGISYCRVDWDPNLSASFSHISLPLFSSYHKKRSCVSYLFLFHMNPSSQHKHLKGGKNSILRQSHYVVLVGQNLLCRPGCPRTWLAVVLLSLSLKSWITGMHYQTWLKKIFILHDFREFQSSLWRQHDRGALFQQWKHVAKTVHII